MWVLTRKRYDFVHLLMKKIRQNNQCSAQEVFTKCVRSWLESPETIIPDMSSVHDSQRELIKKAIADLAYGNVKLFQQALETSIFCKSTS
jgi:hypothetical protein